MTSVSPVDTSTCSHGKQRLPLQLPRIAAVNRFRTAWVPAFVGKRPFFSFVSNVEPPSPRRNLCFTSPYLGIYATYSLL